MNMAAVYMTSEQKENRCGLTPLLCDKSKSHWLVVVLAPFYDKSKSHWLMVIAHLVHALPSDLLLSVEALQRRGRATDNDRRHDHAADDREDGEVRLQLLCSRQANKPMLVSEGLPETMRE